MTLITLILLYKIDIIQWTLTWNWILSVLRKNSTILVVGNPLKHKICTNSLGNTNDYCSFIKDIFMSESSLFMLLFFVSEPKILEVMKVYSVIFVCTVV